MWWLEVSLQLNKLLCTVIKIILTLLTVHSISAAFSNAWNCPFHSTREHYVITTLFNVCWASMGIWMMNWWYEFVSKFCTVVHSDLNTPVNPSLLMDGPCAQNYIAEKQWVYKEWGCQTVSSNCSDFRSQVRLPCILIFSIEIIMYYPSTKHGAPIIFPKILKWIIINTSKLKSYDSEGDVGKFGRVLISPSNDWLNIMHMLWFVFVCSFCNSYPGW